MEVRRMRPKPKISLLDKKIKPNPKYGKVETVINTGNNLRKELERMEEVQHFYKFRNDEIFRRININNLVRLIIEVIKLEHQLDPAGTVEELLPEDSVSECNGSHSDELDLIEREEQEQEEDIGSIIQSQFDGGSTNVISRRSRVGTARPFLILDVRPPDDFLRGHLVLADSYQSTRLNRCYDYETQNMLRLKNKPRAVIVVYDEDESVASKCATTLTQRGYDNVFMLSGGLRVAKRKFPESLVVAGDPNFTRLLEGEVIVLERALEENILAGSSSRLSRSSRSTSIGGVTSKQKYRSCSLEPPLRTSTAMKKII